MMRDIKRTSVLAMIVAFAAVACEPGENQIGEWTTDNDEPSPEVRAQLQDLRSDVEQTLDELRNEIEQLRQEMQAELDDDRMTQVSARVEEAHGDVLSDIERAETSDMDEARRVRDDAAERIAELEADVVRAELEAARDVGTLTQRAERHLTELEDAISELDAHAARQDDGDWFDDDDRVRQRDRDTEGRTEPQRQETQQPERQQPETRQDDRTGQERDDARRDRQEGTGWFDDTLDQQDVENMREELMEIRQDLAQITAETEDNDFEGTRDDLAQRLGDLTHDVKRHWFALQWDLRGQTGATVR